MESNSRNETLDYLCAKKAEGEEKRMDSDHKGELNLKWKLSSGPFKGAQGTSIYWREEKEMIWEEKVKNKQKKGFKE